MSNVPPFFPLSLANPTEPKARDPSLQKEQTWEWRFWSRHFHFDGRCQSEGRKEAQAQVLSKRSLSPGSLLSSLSLSSCTVMTGGDAFDISLKIVLVGESGV